MWFKTRRGLVSLDGPFEYFAARYQRKSGVSVFAMDYRLAHRNLFTWLTPSWRDYVYLACFPDSENANSMVKECMSRIEKAIVDGASICDLSDVGDDESWHAPKGFFMPWQ